MTSSWHATVLTLFPEAFPGVLGVSVLGQALEKHLWRLTPVNIRDFAQDKHKSVDARPAGGGPGMVLRADVAARALDFVVSEDRPVLYLTPRGTPLTQKRIRSLASGPGVILFCGRFEGLDQRVIEARNMEEVSLGDIVLAGGESAALALLEACIRLLPGVLGSHNSTEEESFEQELLEYPHYAAPGLWEGHAIPEILLSGHHDRIRKWRRSQAEAITQKRRPDLWEHYRRRLQERRK